MRIENKRDVLTLTTIGAAAALLGIGAWITTRHDIENSQITLPTKVYASEATEVILYQATEMPNK